MSEGFDPYHKWLGIPPEDQPPHHYRLLGLKLFESDLDVIESAADRQMSHVKTHTTGKYSSLSQQLLNELSAAKVCLLNRERKLAYDERLRASLVPRPIAASVSPIAATSPAAAKAAPASISVPQVSNSATPHITPVKRRLEKPLWHQAAPWISLAVMGLLFVLGATWFMGQQQDPPTVAPIASMVAPAAPTVAPVAPDIPRGVSQDIVSPTPSQPAESRAPLAEAREPTPIAPPIAKASLAAVEAAPSWTQGAVLALAFDEDTLFEKGGKTLVQDLSGQSNHGLIHGAASVSGKLGEAVRITAKDQYVECADSESLIPTDGLTLAAWVNAVAWRGDISAVICKSSGLRGVKQGYELRCPDNGRGSFVVGASIWKEIKSPDRMSTQSWHHLAATYDRNKLRLYIDGSQVAEAAHERAISRPMQPLRIGAHSYLTDRTFTGQIDEVAVWNRSLSPEEVRNLYQHSRGGNSYCLAIGAASNALPVKVAAKPADVPADSSPTPPGTLADLLEPGGGHVNPAKLLPKPAAEELKVAQETIEQTYQTELTAAKSPLEKEAIAIGSSSAWARNSSSKRLSRSMVSPVDQ